MTRTARKTRVPARRAMTAPTEPIGPGGMDLPPGVMTPPNDEAAPRLNKTDAVIGMLQRPQGASLDEIVELTGWQRHSARGALAGAVRKKLGAAVLSELTESGRRYRAPETVS